MDQPAAADGVVPHQHDGTSRKEEDAEAVLLQTRLRQILLRLIPSFVERLFDGLPVAVVAFPNVMGVAHLLH